MYCNTLLATYATVLGEISSSKLILSPRLNAQKMMRMEDDNVIEVDSYILKPSGTHTSTAADGSSNFRKPSVSELSVYQSICFVPTYVERHIPADG